MTAVLLSCILREEQKNIFLDSLCTDFAKKGSFNRQFQELCLQVVISQYLDLIEEKVPKELLQSTKETVRSTLELMLQIVEEIK